MKKIIKMMILILILTSVLVFGGLSFAGENESNEEKIEELPSQWALEDIEKIRENDYLTDSFLKDFKDDMTRQEFSYLSVRLYEILTDFTTTIGNEKFDDTNDEYVLKAKNIGIVNGTGENIFQPDEPISRQEVAVMFMRTLDKGFIDYDKPQYIVNDIERSFSKSDLGPGGKIITELHRIGIEFFEDSDQIFDWSYHSVEDLYVLGIMNGINNQDFGPNDQLSKEMAFVIFNRIIEKFKDEKPTYIPIEQKELEEMSLLDLRIRVGWDYYTIREVFDDFYSPKFSDITYINALANPAIKLSSLENKDIYDSYENKMELISLVNQIEKPDEEVHTLIFQYNIYEDEYCHAVIGSNGETRDKLNPIFTPEDVHSIWVNYDAIFENDAIHFIDKTRELDDEDRFEFYHRFEVLDYLIKIGNDYYPLREIIKTANEIVSYSTEPWIEDMNVFSEEEFKKNLIDEFKTENVTEIINYDTFLSPGLYIKSDSLYHPVTKEKVTAESIPSGMAFDYEAYMYGSKPKYYNENVWYGMRCELTKHEDGNISIKYSKNREGDQNFETE